MLFVDDLMLPKSSHFNYCLYILYGQPMDTFRRLGAPTPISLNIGLSFNNNKNKRDSRITLYYAVPCPIHNRTLNIFLWSRAIEISIILTLLLMIFIFGFSTKVTCGFLRQKQLIKTLSKINDIIYQIKVSRVKL